MASLEDLSRSLGVDLNPSNKKAGKKRRSWLLEKNSDNQSTKGLQTGDNQSTKSSSYDYNSLTGIQKKIVEYMYKSCLDIKTRITQKINIQDIQTALEIGESSAKTSILRLKEKKCIFIYSRKNGRGGWCKYEIERNLFHSMINGLQNDKNIGDQSSIYNSNTITINKNKSEQRQDQNTNNTLDSNIIAQLQQQILELQKSQQNTIAKTENEIQTLEKNENIEEWSNIDISSLEPFGFNQKHLKQIIAFNDKLDDKSKITFSDLQESIEHYSWALENRLEEMTEKYGKGFANNKLRVLMGVLKQGKSWIEPQYESPEEMAIKEQVNANKVRLERIQALKEEQFNTAFELWKAQLTKAQFDEIRASLSSTYSKLSDDSKMLVTAFKKHFKENVYGE
ncbi:hypothetical protein [Facilibium subflavum]|uniref:hypothetical protein n=1 Tax=Facilibium subflavum TaxID=2219058 RepID=UPI000E65629C|nr:hypothetical protein [Facilibium subflavum]